MQNHTLQLEFCQLACNADNQWFIFDKPVNFHWSAFLEATWFSQQTALQFAMLEVVALYNCGRWRGCRRWKCTNWLERVYKWSGNGKYLSTPMPSNSPEVITGVSVYSVHCMQVVFFSRPPLFLWHFLTPGASLDLITGACVQCTLK